MPTDFNLFRARFTEAKGFDPSLPSLCRKSLNVSDGNPHWSEGFESRISSIFKAVKGVKGSEGSLL
jgi:hypothetical protein